MWLLLPRTGTAAEGRIQNLLCETLCDLCVLCVKRNSPPPRLGQPAKDGYEIGCRQRLRALEDRDETLLFVPGTTAYQYPKLTSASSRAANAA